MALSGIKENKCFAPTFAPKYKDSYTLEIDANDNEYYSFFDDAILATDCAAISVQRADGDTVDEITTGAAVITDGAVIVKVFNSGSTAKTITVNCIVL